MSFVRRGFRCDKDRFQNPRSSAEKIPNDAKNERDRHDDDGFSCILPGSRTYLRHSEVTMKDGALRINVQRTLEVILGQLELLLSKVLFMWFEITKGNMRGVVFLGGGGRARGRSFFCHSASSKRILLSEDHYRRAMILTIAPRPYQAL